MEALIIGLILYGTIVSGAACFYRASDRSKAVWIAKQDEWIATLRLELKDWQNKALFKNGLSPLGRETEKREPLPQKQTAKIIHRGEMRARVEDGVTIHAEKIDYKRVKRQETVDKAGEILGK